MAKAKGVYEGRLMCDGNGNLLADESKFVGWAEITAEEDGEAILDSNGEPTVVRVPKFKYGENHGMPVAYHEGSYVFLNAGDESHNDRHHERFVEFAGTTDAAAEGEEHHLQPTEDDPHYDADSENLTRLRFDPDKVAAKMTGHTAAYTGGDE